MVGDWVGMALVGLTMGVGVKVGAGAVGVKVDVAVASDVETTEGVEVASGTQPQTEGSQCFPWMQSTFCTQKVALGLGEGDAATGVALVEGVTVPVTLVVGVDRGVGVRVGVGVRWKWKKSMLEPGPSGTIKLWVQATGSPRNPARPINNIHLERIMCFLRENRMVGNESFQPQKRGVPTGLTAWLRHTFLHG